MVMMMMMMMMKNLLRSHRENSKERVVELWMTVRLLSGSNQRLQIVGNVSFFVGIRGVIGTITPPD